MEMAVFNSLEYDLVDRELIKIGLKYYKKKYNHNLNIRYYFIRIGGKKETVNSIESNNVHKNNVHRNNMNLKKINN
jgi:hypothetical protein